MFIGSRYVFSEENCPSGRKTPFENKFSPYILQPGLPIHITTGFNIAQALSDINNMHIANENDGYESEDEREVEASPPLCPALLLPMTTPSALYPRNLEPTSPLDVNIRSSKDLTCWKAYSKKSRRR
jgi:hypothetical protein